MKNDVRRRAFEPFLTTKFQGRGLGLAAVYGIIRNHNGAITIRSDAGRGSDVTVYLSVSPEQYSENNGRIQSIDV